MELEKMRAQIEGLNDEIIALLAKRKALTLKIAELKKKEKMPIYDPVREERQRTAISIKAQANNLNPEAVVSFFDNFVAYCRQEMENHWESLH